MLHCRCWECLFLAGWNLFRLEENFNCGGECECMFVYWFARVALLREWTTLIESLCVGKKVYVRVLPTVEFSGESENLKSWNLERDVAWEQMCGSCGISLHLLMKLVDSSIWNLCISMLVTYLLMEKRVSVDSRIDSDVLRFLSYLQMKLCIFIAAGIHSLVQ